MLAGTPLVGPDKLDANYKFSGETTLTPDKVFNDGVRTYVQWKTLPPELPEVVVSGASGTGQLLNFRVVGAMYVIDTVLPNFDLVLGSDTDRRGRPERRLSIRHQ